MKQKIEVKSWNYYPPSHTPREGKGLIRLTLHPETITIGCKIVQWNHKIPKRYCLRK